MGVGVDFFFNEAKGQSCFSLSAFPRGSSVLQPIFCSTDAVFYISSLVYFLIFVSFSPFVPGGLCLPPNDIFSTAWPAAH